MALTPAQKQAAYRARKQAEIASLRAASTSPFADCTPEEVDYLLRMLKALRDQSVTPIMQEANKLAKDAAKVRADSAKAHRDSLAPPDGEYWVVRFNAALMTHTAAKVILVTNAKGKRQAINEDASLAVFRFNHKRYLWEIDGQRVMTREEATRVAKERTEADAAYRRPTKGPNPLAGMTVAELRRLRSLHHPDKGNPDADPATYQFAVEALDAMR